MCVCNMYGCVCASVWGVCVRVDVLCVCESKRAVDDACVSVVRTVFMQSLVSSIEYQCSTLGC